MSDDVRRLQPAKRDEPDARPASGEKAAGAKVPATAPRWWVPVAVEHTPPEARMPRWDQPRPSRWASSATTFGPAGRLVATVVCTMIPVLALEYVAFPWNGVAFVPLVMLLPRALRDIWQPVPVPHAPPEPPGGADPEPLGRTDP